MWRIATSPTEKRRYIIADTPGHEMYTRNMVTGASTAHLIILLIDAKAGIQTQSKRHAFISSLLGIPNVIVAINKMDLVDYSQERYEELCAEYRSFCARLKLGSLTFTPDQCARRRSNRQPRRQHAVVRRNDDPRETRSNLRRQ